MDPVALALQTPDAQSFERAALDELDRCIGFDAAFFATKLGPPTTRAIDATSLAQGIARGTYDRELAPLKRVARARRNVVVDTEILGDGAVRRMAYHRDFAAPVGGRHTLLACLELRGRPLGALVLGRCTRAFSRADVNAMEALVPALAVARASFAALGSFAPLAPPRLMLGGVFEALRGERVLGAITVSMGRSSSATVETTGRWSRGAAAPSSSGHALTCGTRPNRGGSTSISSSSLGPWRLSAGGRCSSAAAAPSPCTSSRAPTRVSRWTSWSPIRGS